MTERREYIRINSVLPVEFFVINNEGKRATPWLQGFTHDICKGGIQLFINDLWWGFWDRFNYKDAQIFLRIDLPFSKRTISTKAKVVRFDQERARDFNRYIVGLKFLDLDKKEADTLLKYALLKKTLPVLAVSFIVILSFFSGSLIWKTKSLTYENRSLVRDYVSVLKEDSQLKGLLETEKNSGLFLRERQEYLQNKIVSLEEETVLWQKNYSSFKETAKDREDLFSQAKQLTEKTGILQEELSALKRENAFLKTKEEERKRTAAILKEKSGVIQKEKWESSAKIIESMYTWIKNRQDLIRGLVLSFEGARDLNKICFTYDQALAADVFLLFNDRERAEKILNFYLAKAEKDGVIYNGYYCQGDVSEYIVHSGPNAWIGMAALNYTKMTGNKKYLPIALKVSGFLFSMMDSEGGIKGGPQVSWYATEHNLDAYAFFTALYQLTGEKKYEDAAQKIKKWIVKYSYTSYGSPAVNRGKGDSTIATDTYAWSITAFSPQSLFSLNMNPEAILDFAVQNCEVEVVFNRKEGDVTLRGFDFAKFKNTARGGVVSGEWTAQMILSFQEMADYYEDKDPDKYKQYLDKSIFYFNELQKMLITSPSMAGREDPCLPYASRANVDTGHGWRTPQGDKTGSLSSTAYFLISYFGYNPLKGEFLKVSLKDFYERKRSEVAAGIN